MQVNEGPPPFDDARFAARSEQPAEYRSDPPASPLQSQVGGIHYKGMKIQPIEYIHANGIPFAEGNVIKYVSRWRDKGGIDDLKKARHYIDLLIDLETRHGLHAPVGT